MTPLVVLTQAAEGGDSLARQLAAAGLEVATWPLVKLTPIAIEAIRPTLEQLGDYDWVLLPSPSAVRLVARRMKELGIPWPAGTRAGLVGPASVDAFRDCFGEGPEVDTPPAPPHDARHLIETLSPHGTGASGPACVRRALVLNRPDGRTDWVEELAQKAGTVEVVSAYTAETLSDGPPPTVMERLRQRQAADAPIRWVIGSSSQVDTLLQALPAHWSAWAKRQPLLAPHPAIRAHAEAAGFENAQVYHHRRDLVERLQ